jgi:DMSO/TMAO reductase YedYZ molybdopterin-dependent catalytic subunit
MHDDAMTSTSSIRPALAGMLGVGTALGLAELLAGLLPGATSLVAAVGQVIIDVQPPGAKDFVVALFGTNDKLALELFIVAVSVAIGAVLGVASRRRFLVGALGFGIFGALGFAAALRDPTAEPAMAAATAALAVAAGIQAMGWLLGPRGSASTSAPAAMPDWSRRDLLIRSSALGVVALAAGVGGRALIERVRVAPSGAGAQIPPASETVGPLPAGADLTPEVADLTPIVIPNDRFYRIDTALLVPSVDADRWALRIHGLVERETTLTFPELTGLPMFEQYVTIACVSNEVGGRLVGNAKWTGVHLRDVLDLAGVRRDASQLVGRSVDGWTAGMPTAWIMDAARDAMIAVRMNDEPLPPAHGFPARLIVPGLYGYVSATKWLTELELTTMEAFDGYWVPLGWAKEAPILTQSRIDTPRLGVTIPTGLTPIAGVAWAPDRGVSRVEVAVDDVWDEARLSTPISDATWVQWLVDWDATPGRHTIAVRATDGHGEVQTERRTAPAPDGARGWHTISVTVS